MNYYELFHETHRYLQYRTDLEKFVISNKIDFENEVSPFVPNKAFIYNEDSHPFEIKWPYRRQDDSTILILPVTPNYESDKLRLKILSLWPKEGIDLKTQICALLDFHFKRYEGLAVNFFDFIDSVLNKIYTEGTIRQGVHLPDTAEMLAEGKNWVVQQRARNDAIIKEFTQQKESMETEKHEKPKIQHSTMETIEEATTDETKTNLRIQMLIIHFLSKLGHLKVDFHDKNKIAPLFSLLLGRDEQNIRKNLGYNQPEFIENDLKLLLPLFESLGEPAKPVIDNIKKNIKSIENDPNNKPNRKKFLQS